MPRGSRSTLWFDRYPDRVEQGLPARYDVRISYTGPSGKGYSETTVLDLGMYRDIGEITRYGIHDVHNRLKEISSTLKSWTHPEGLKVLTREDHKRYVAEIRRRQAERQRADAEDDGGRADETQGGGPPN